MIDMTEGTPCSAAATKPIALLADRQHVEGVKALSGGGAQGVCCFFLKYGKCEPPRGVCRFRHDIPNDDGVVPCCFGATCRLGHASRALAKNMDEKDKLEYWRHYKESDELHVVGDTPAIRDATLLRSQLEPWPTAILRKRLVCVFGESYAELDGLGRGEMMRRLLTHYETSERPRRTIRVKGSLISEELQKELLAELQKWRARHTTNTRPSINAKSYMILRSPMEFQQKNSSKARIAAKKLQQNEQLWKYAKMAIEQVDPEFACNFSALAVTFDFTGSPHIDKQNTGPFYGLALGDFHGGEICVEVDAFCVARINTKNRLGKVDGQFPHWVAPYDGERYSLIYYSTWQTYEQPTTAYFGQHDEEEEQ
jgi:hypothetical protein